MNKTSACLLNQRFPVISLYLKITEKISRSKATRFFAPFPNSARPKLLLQFYFKNNKDV